MDSRPGDFPILLHRFVRGRTIFCRIPSEEWRTLHGAAPLVQEIDGIAAQLWSRRSAQQPSR